MRSKYSGNGSEREKGEEGRGLFKTKTFLRLEASNSEK